MREGKELIGKRIGAYLIDSLVIPLIVSIVLGGLGAVAGLCFMPFMNSSERFTPLVILALLGFCGGMFIAFIYFFIKDGLANGSFGKRWLGLRVVRTPGNEPCGMGASALRNLFLMISPLNLVEYIMIFVDAKAERLGDKVAKTKVVES